MTKRRSPWSLLLPGLKRTELPQFNSREAGNWELWFRELQNLENQLLYPRFEPAPNRRKAGRKSCASTPGFRPEQALQTGHTAPAGKINAGYSPNSDPPQPSGSNWLSVYKGSTAPGSQSPHIVSHTRLTNGLGTDTGPENFQHTVPQGIFCLRKTVLNVGNSTGFDFLCTGLTSAQAH